MHQDLRNLLTLVAARGVAVPVALLATALLGRLLGPDGVGYWAMVVGAGTLLHSLFLNWTHAISVRFGCSEWRERQRLDETFAMRVPLLITAGVTIGLLLWLPPFDWLHSGFGVHRSDTWMVLVYVLSMWFLAELRSLMQVTAHYSWLGTTPALTELVGAVFLGGALLMGGLGLSSTTIFGWLAVLLSVTPAIMFLVELRKCRLGVGTTSVSRIMEGVRFARPLILNFLIGYIAAWGGQVILQVHYSSGEVGLFRAAYQLLLLALSVSAPLATVLLPRLLAAADNNPQFSQHYVEKVIPTLVVIWLPCTFLALALSPVVVPILYGDRFAASSQVLVLLCGALPGSILTTLYGVLLNLQGRLSRSTVYHALTAIVNIGLCIMLSPLFGVVGVAVGTVASYVISQWCYLFDQHRYFSLPMGRMGTLFGIALIYSMIQAFFVEALLGRTILALAFSAITIAFVRRYRVADCSVLAKLFSGRLSGLGAILVRTLIVKPSH